MDTKKTSRDFIDKTVFFTPTPSASSTVQKKEIHKIVDKQRLPAPMFSDINESEGSFGVLSASDLGDGNLNEMLQKNRILAATTLQKSSMSRISGLPSHFLKPSPIQSHTYSNFVANTESTINESDLVNVSAQRNKIFHPNEISTPRASDISEISSVSFSKSIAQLKDEIMNTDISISDAYERYNRNFANYERNENTGDSGLFLSDQMAADKLLKDELSWRRERDIPIDANTSTRSNFSGISANYNDCVSMGEFFQRRSENIEDLPVAASPEKKHEPIPLIDASSFEYSGKGTDVVGTSIENSMCTPEVNSNSSLSIVDNSVLTISQIAQVISEMNTVNTPTRTIKYLVDKKGKHVLNSSEEGEAHVFDKKRKSFNSIGSFKENTKKVNNTSKQMQKEYSEPLKGSNNFNKDTNTDNESASEEHLSQRTISTIRSAASYENLTCGRLPIDSNTSELVWGCIKLGKSITQQFIIRNRSEHRIRFQISVTGSSYKILKDRSELEPLKTLQVLLHPMESRSYAIMFCPTKIGAAVEKLNFHRINGDSEQTKRQYLMLYGYGGHSQVEVLKVAKHPSGKYWLSLGNLEQRTEVQQEFLLRNVGKLPAFICLRVCSKGLYSFSSIKVHPNDAVLEPKSDINIVVTYTPSKQDLKHMCNSGSVEVVEIGIIQVITGAEPLRARLRNLNQKLYRKSGITGDAFLQRISKHFNGENLPSDLSRFTETADCMKELLQQLVMKEIILTVEHDVDRTLITEMAVGDDTTIFKSIYQDFTQMTVLDSSVKDNRIGFKIEPNNILLTPPIKVQDTLLLSCEQSNYIQFEVSVTPNNCLSVHPMEGVVSPGETVVIKLTCSKITKPQENYKVVVYVENDVMEIDVKVMNVQHVRFKY